MKKYEDFEKKTLSLDTFFSSSRKTLQKKIYETFTIEEMKIIDRELFKNVTLDELIENEETIAQLRKNRNDKSFIRFINKGNRIISVFKTCKNSPYCNDNNCQYKHYHQSKKRCNFGKRCNKRGCPFTHNCPFKENCTDKNCTFSHEICRYDGHCGKRICYFDHLKKNTNKCNNKENCYNALCNFIHDN